MFELQRLPASVRAEIVAVAIAGRVAPVDIVREGIRAVRQRFTGPEEALAEEIQKRLLSDSKPAQPPHGALFSLNPDSPTPRLGSIKRAISDQLSNRTFSLEDFGRAVLQAMQYSAETGEFGVATSFRTPKRAASAWLSQFRKEGRLQREESKME
jgi:hypothetical protein